MPRATSRRSGEKGATAVVVAFSMLALVVIIGAAIDLAQVIYARNSLQSSMDAAMKAAAAVSLDKAADEDADPSDVDKMKKVATNFFNVNMKLGPGVVESVSFVPDYVDDATQEDSVVATVDARIRLNFARILGMDNVPVRLTAVARRPRAAPVELVITMDVTESMNETFGTTTKLEALKDSAKSLVGVLMKSQYAKVGLVPFGWLIRLDPDGGYYDKSVKASLVPWLAFGQQPTIYDCFKWEKTNCQQVDGTCYRDGVPYTCKVEKCDSLVCKDPRLRPVTWDGCVFIRPPPYRTRIDSPTAPPYYGVWSAGTCPLTPIITDLVDRSRNYVLNSKTMKAEDFLKAKIDALKIQTVGGTYIPGALIWSWNMLSTESRNGAPDTNYPLNSGFSEEERQKRGVRRVLVLITDGNNSLFAFRNGQWDQLGTILNKANSPAQQAQFLQETTNDMVATCNNIKDSGIDIYVIALQLTQADLAYKSMLRDQCATRSTADAEFFFDVSDPQKLQEAFERIGKSLSYNSLVE